MSEAAANKRFVRVSESYSQINYTIFFQGFLCIYTLI